MVRSHLSWKGCKGTSEIFLSVCATFVSVEKITKESFFLSHPVQPLGSRRLLCRWHLHVWLAMIYHHLGIAERSPALAITSSIHRSSSVVRSIKKTWVSIVSTFLFVSVQIWVSKFLMPQLGVQEHLRVEVRLSLNFPVAKQKLK